MLRWLGGGPWVSGRQVDKLMGHYAYPACLNRAALAPMRALNSFIWDSYEVPQVLWKSARFEARCMAWILPLVVVDLNKAWSAGLTS